ncbi:MAG: ImmA/IrrE family metallo-endopeptidase [Dehalococcoidales bacterium]|nr:ImmA/IrrE family metallo-endopeptidase [Dehalococcoidales bacterium]
MMLPAAEFIPDIVLERRALHLIREYERQRSARVILPVPIEKMIEQTLELQVVWLPIQEAPGEIILARIDPAYNGQRTIQMNEYRQDHFQEFFGTEAYSLAHEAGHWVLHLNRGRSHQQALPGLDISPIRDPMLCRRMNDADRREFQSERFAAFLLMPEYLMNDAIPNWDLTRWSAIADLARWCGVSKRAMTRRLQELGKIVVRPDGRLSLPSYRKDVERLL